MASPRVARHGTPHLAGARDGRRVRIGSVARRVYYSRQCTEARCGHAVVHPSAQRLRTAHAPAHDARVLAPHLARLSGHAQREGQGEGQGERILSRAAGHRVLRIEERACELAVGRPPAQVNGMLESGASREVSLTLDSRGAAWVRQECGKGAARVRHGPSEAALVTAHSYSDSYSYHLLALPTCGGTASARTSGSRGGPRGGGRADGGHAP